MSTSPYWFKEMLSVNQHNAIALGRSWIGGKNPLRYRCWPLRSGRFGFGRFRNADGLGPFAYLLDVCLPAFIVALTYLCLPIEAEVIAITLSAHWCFVDLASLFKFQPIV